MRNHLPLERGPDHVAEDGPAAYHHEDHADGEGYELSQCLEHAQPFADEDDGQHHAEHPHEQCDQLAIEIPGWQAGRGFRRCCVGYRVIARAGDGLADGGQVHPRRVKADDGFLRRQEDVDCLDAG